MRSLGRIFAIAFIYALTCVAWLILGGITMHRSQTQSSSLRSDVHELWGREHVQEAPKLFFEGTPPPPSAPPRAAVASVRGDAEYLPPAQTSPPAAHAPSSLQPAATDMKVGLILDQRLKGLTWYPLYDVGFDATWRYVHEAETDEVLVVSFNFPDPNGVFDDFNFLVDGEPVRAEPSNGGVTTRVPVSPGQELTISAAYKSRGLARWEYRPSVGASSLKDFRLEMTTNFDAVDFPESTLSPSTLEDSGDGKRLVWDFKQVVSGRGIGMIMPTRIQPGELASSLSFSAPISLVFFFLVVGVLAKLRGLEIHPVNYFFIGAAFFSFHLLFAYTVDHVSVWTAFALSSIASVAMVTAYLRLVVSPRFAFVESGLAQLIYLVGFSLAHFWQGMTGLTITILSIGTLTLLMLLTGRVRWSEVLEKVGPSRGTPPGPHAVPMGTFFPPPPAPPAAQE